MTATPTAKPGAKTKGKTNPETAAKSDAKQADPPQATATSTASPPQTGDDAVTVSRDELAAMIDQRMEVERDLIRRDLLQEMNSPQWSQQAPSNPAAGKAWAHGELTAGQYLGPNDTVPNDRWFVQKMIDGSFQAWPRSRVNPLQRRETLAAMDRQYKQRIAGVDGLRREAGLYGVDAALIRSTRLSVLAVNKTWAKLLGHECEDWGEGDHRVRVLPVDHPDGKSLDERSPPQPWFSFVIANVKKLREAIEKRKAETVATPDLSPADLEMLTGADFGGDLDAAPPSPDAAPITL